jgi:hypothetical protein
MSISEAMLNDLLGFRPELKTKRAAVVGGIGTKSAQLAVQLLMEQREMLVEAQEAEIQTLKKSGAPATVISKRRELHQRELELRLSLAQGLGEAGQQMLQSVGKRTATK